MRHSSIKFVILLLCLLTLSFKPAKAQDQQGPLKAEWVQNDVDGVKFLVGLTPIENHSVGNLRKQFEARTGDTSWFDEENLGFGAKREKLHLGLGYTSVYIDFLLFRNRIIHYKIGADGSRREWSRHGQTVINAWKENGGPPFIQRDAEIIYEKDFAEVWTAYRAEMAKQLGPMKPVGVPNALSAHYELLINPFENSEISMVACTDAKPAIDALEDAKRLDLIENVLRGYNPGGRIYAAISLLRMQRKGKRVTRNTIAAIKKIAKLDASAATCWGDTGITGLRARDIIPEYVKSKDWYLLRR